MSARSWSEQGLCRSALAVALGLALAPAAASGVIVKTNAGGGADARVTENTPTGVIGPTGATSGGSGTSTIDVRSNGNLTANRDKNEIGLLRFDLSPGVAGLNRTDIATAQLEMVYQRTGPQSGSFDVYGVLPGVSGEDSWDEGAISFNNAPGFTFDGDTSTRGINPGDTQFLGTVAFANQTKPPTVADIDNGIGVIKFGDDEDNTALVNFLRLADTDDLVSFILTVTNEGNTQYRLASKELTSLESGTPAGNAGDFAARLVVAVPEPASLGVLGLAAVMSMRRRRR